MPREGRDPPERKKRRKKPVDPGEKAREKEGLKGNFYLVKTRETLVADKKKTVSERAGRASRGKRYIQLAGESSVKKECRDTAG